MRNIYLFQPKKLGTIAPELYGVFSEHIGGEIYDGIYCGDKADNINGFRKFIIDRMKQAKIPLVRWPGGCFAEIYDWRDGIGPREKRPVRVNWWTNCDGRYEPNIVGTDEFLDFCRLCEAEPYMAANITSSTPLNIRDWIDYCNSPAGTTSMAKLRAENGHAEPYNVKLWGVGNETWGGGGNMTPTEYATEYRRYAAVMNNTSKGLELIGSGANAGDYSWTRGFLEGISKKHVCMHGMSFHYYCGGAGDPISFTDAEWNQLISQAAKMQELIDRHWSGVVSYGLEQCAKLCIDEWGCWHPEGSGPSKGANLFEQQSTMRDAVVTALTLNIFNNNCDKIKLCTVAQLVNNLHSLFLSSGAECIATPTYHVFEMYKNHQGGEAIEAVSEDDCISVSASVKDGRMTVTLANTSPDRDITVNLKPVGCTLADKAELAMLGDGDIHAHNTFDAPERVRTVYKSGDFNGMVELVRGSVASVTFGIADNG